LPRSGAQEELIKHYVEYYRSHRKSAPRGVYFAACGIGFAVLVFY
jgi:hypothetical protein